MKTKEFFPQMHLCCTNDDLRPVMQYVFITKNHTVATNARIMAISKTSDLFDDDFLNIIPDDGLFIHKDDWKKICQSENVVVESDNVLELIHKRKRNELIKIEHTEKIGTFPNWKSVVPSEEKTGKENFNFFGLNGNLLKTINDVINKNQGVFIETFKKHSGFLVKSIAEKCNTIGLIMPCNVSGDIVEKIEIPS